MHLIKIICANCGKPFLKPRNRVNEAKKYNWKHFCSAECLARSKMNGRILVCANPKCKKKFYRPINEINKEGRNFCSRSCAAQINNSEYPKRKAPIKTCLHCGKIFKATKQKLYCSRKCKNKAQIISAEEILIKIKEFYKNNGRIPYKEEFPHYNAAQNRFGSWNKAIEAAGFEPNPVRFAKRYIAQDGHQCDSFAEKIIDDWLYENNIEHERNKKYPDNPKLTVDFVTKYHWIEFFGLVREIKEYDTVARKKRKLAQKYKLPLIAIYPKDLFPVNRLSEIIRVKNE